MTDPMSPEAVAALLGCSKDIGDLYEWHEVVRFTRKDAARLRRFLAAGRVAVRRVG